MDTELIEFCQENNIEIRDGKISLSALQTAVGISPHEEAENNEIVKMMKIQYDLMGDILKSLKDVENACNTYNNVMKDLKIEALLTDQAKKGETQIREKKTKVFKLIDDTI